MNLTVDVVVVADSEREAHEAANMGFDELSFSDFGAFAVREVKSEDDLPDGWDLDDKPLGSGYPIHLHGHIRERSDAPRKPEDVKP